MGPMLGFSNSVPSSLLFFPHFSCRDAEKGQGAESHLKGLGRHEVANVSSKIHNNPCNLKIISRRHHDTFLNVTFKNSEHSFRTCECVQRHRQL